MTISNELMRAILAMDVYNRGYNSGIVMPGSVAGSGVGSQIGEASFASDLGQTDAQAIGFYAAAYTLADGISPATIARTVGRMRH